MPALQNEYITILGSFERLFSQRIWKHAKILLMGAILSPAERTVTAALRMTGLSMDKHFQNYHRVLNRAKWSSLEASHILLGLLVSAFALCGPIILGLDDTIERRRGAQIKAKGIYRDPVRSSHGHFVKASGLRWLSLMLLAPIPWAGRIWALPFLTVLAPSERYYQGKSRKHKKLTEWALQLVLQVRRWLPKRQLVVVADSGFAVIELLFQLCQLKNPVCMIVRFRMDAALYEPAKNSPGQKGRPRRRANAYPLWKRLPKTNILIGSGLPCKSGTAKRNAKLKSLLERPSGLITGSPPCRSVGSLCVIHCMFSKPKLCYALISKSWLSKSFSGFRDVGKSKSRFMKSELTSASRPKDNGQTYPSCALHPLCSACSRSSPCSPTYTPINKSCLSSRPPGMLKSYPLFRMRSRSSSKLWHPKSIFELRQFIAMCENHRRLAPNTALLPLIGHFDNNIFG